MWGSEEGGVLKCGERKVLSKCTVEIVDRVLSVFIVKC